MLVSPIADNKSYELYNGDCFEVLKQFPEETFDMIFADPPYMLSKTGKTCYNGKLVKLDKGAWDESRGIAEDFEFHKQWLALCKKLLKPNGTLWVSGTYHSIFSCGYAMLLLGYHVLNNVAWFKPNATPNLSCKYFTASHESLVWARKDKKAKHYFNYDAMKNGDFPQDFIKKPHTQMRTVWAIPTTQMSEKTFGKHPTQKPLALLERIITASTHENDLILDPFMGSGTTGVAALKLKRRFVGVELNPQYYDLAGKRIANVLDVKQSDLFTREG